MIFNYICYAEEKKDHPAYRAEAWAFGVYIIDISFLN